MTNLETILTFALEMDKKAQSEDLYVQAVIRDVVSIIEKYMGTNLVEEVLSELLEISSYITAQEVTLANMVDDIIAVAEQNLV